jgi:uncharacterized protein (UPF0548 family)
MLFIHRPTNHQIRGLLAKRESMTFSYPEVGATLSTPPAAYRINHMRALLGKGPTVHDRAVKALLSWQLLAVAGLELFPNNPAMRPRTNVALLSRHFGLWSLDFCRVINVLERPNENGSAIQRTGFAYGTLPGHALCGEEIFSVAWHTATEEVWYDIFSFSRPANWLVQLAAPIVGATQKRFARASLEKAVHLASSSEQHS